MIYILEDYNSSADMYTTYLVKSNATYHDIELLLMWAQNGIRLLAMFMDGFGHTFDVPQELFSLGFDCTVLFDNRELDLLTWQDGACVLSKEFLVEVSAYEHKYLDGNLGAYTVRRRCLAAVDAELEKYK